LTELEEPLTNTLLEPAQETHTAAPSPLANLAELAKEGIRVVGVEVPGMAEILTPEALRFVALLQRTFGPRRLELLAAREERKLSLDAWEAIGFLPETEGVRNAEWKVAPIPADLRDRRVEITGPVDRKMIINALNSGAPRTWPTSRIRPRPRGGT
jgi:malate synthase